MLQNGITVGELRKLLNASEVIDVLEKIGVDTGALGQVIKVINKLPSIADNLRISIGAPNHAGIYSVTAVTDNKNYNTGVGAGALVLKADKAKLVWNQSIGKKISAAEAAGADFVKTSTGYGTKGCTIDDLKLMRASVSDHVRVKGSGGIRDLDTVLAARAAGASRCGVSATEKIMAEAEARYREGKL